MSKIVKVISGGQTGADMGGLLAARELGITTGGWAPKGWMTEKGPREALLRTFGLIESEGGYPVRTKENIRDSDFTIIIAERLDGGSRLTANHCAKIRKPCFWLDSFTDMEVEGIPDLLAWAHSLPNVRPAHLILNVAGNRESKNSGIEQRSALLMRCFLQAFNNGEGRAE